MCKKVVVIGAGAIGKSIGYLLHQKGYEILGFLSRRLESAQAGVDLIDEGIATTKYRKFILKADLILITTPDQSIQGVAEKLFTKGLVKEGASLIHCSGAHSSQILIPQLEDEERYGRLSLHPLQSVADVEKGINSLPNSFFTMEGNELGCKTGEEILTELGVDYEVISAQAKPLYHAAACVASNYLVTIINLALKMNQKAGVAPEKALKGLLPLMQGTLDNINDLGPTKALTGPISRGDTETIEGHLESLEALLPGELDLYRDLGNNTVEVAQKKGSVTKKELEELKEILTEEGLNNE
ncbi:MULTISPECIES: Rossmann-like and DUF2520 domain-containing protein [unclassified Candidatus Frackibacter]|uniref:Rossmann-like and DUF2520 domain-containing protein n=1 Tax=unclassified Candidatus Frackibacter TaxID=2648818 RepID=UPI0008812639|nr:MULTISPECIES: Rossmann-like and DUF2520 domain-containing protein [unclassified Candidatus Frackibacter]SDC84873.1 Predicted oxidoreductase, contains short-chain dehydrogenase (SDR) and DUF2520 domains [Candidatus Frackibacter sp. WG11]SEM99306.1 Predicted oxidoreductase, contains short-chain dehydrogenase (SDR) and DUF2520 domains [Candidatus Frackibacter sp. WG12]SFM07304.1 Predicted oxidoreductase, contains short-chain dehydrogenase (SDR) and DUF2520 domains [Candidatus Frackibacter sp. WG